MLLRSIFALEPHPLHLVANLDGEVALGLRKRLGRVFVLPLGSVAACDALVDELADDLGMPGRELDGLLFRIAEDDLAEAGRGGIVLR